MPIRTSSAHSPRPDSVIQDIAARQHGVVSRAQLLAAGVGAGALDRRAAAGRLVRLHRGVYRVGPVVAPRAPEMAALLACGASSVISHHSAAALHRQFPPQGEPEVSVPWRSRLQRPHIRIHRAASLPSEDVTRLDGLRVTTPSRTLCDLAGVVAFRDLERALAVTLNESRTTPSRIRAVLDRQPRRRGSRRLRALLDADVSPALTRSEAEEAFLTLIARTPLSRPETNARVAGIEVDCLWRAERLVAEIDGFAYHASARRFESDRRRDAVLVGAGLRVVRVTWRQIVGEPEALLVRLTRALGG